VICTKFLFQKHQAGKKAKAPSNLMLGMLKIKLAPIKISFFLLSDENLVRQCLILD